jgi:prepilin-type N-terminal cleavage/methylation domain-containing protein
MKIKMNKKAFSLPEVIIAVSIIALIIITSTNLLVSSMRANRTNINQIIAYNLAEEAIEGLRDIRDSNWLNNQIWTGSPEPQKQLFGSSFGDDGFYIIEKQHNAFSPGSCGGAGYDNINIIGVVRDYVPWKLTRLNDADDVRKNLYYKNEGEIIMYTHNATGEESGYSRWLEVKNLNEEKTKIAVKAVVEWYDGSIKRNLEISTILTDWKTGPI